MSSEQQLEERFIQKLLSLKYEYRPDIRNRAALEANFRAKFQELNRVKLTSLVTDGTFLKGFGTLVVDANDNSDEAEFLARELVGKVKGLRTAGAALAELAHAGQTPGKLADAVAAALMLEPEEAEGVLAEADAAARLRLVLGILAKQLARAELKEKIEADVRRQFGKHQREAVLREQPDHARALSVAGFLYAEQNRLAQAIGAFERAVALNPGEAATQFNLGFVLQKAGRHEEAIARLARATELQPSLDRAWYGLGLSLIQRGRFREAIDKLSEAARLQPLNPYPRYQLGAAWFKLGEPEKVRAQYRKLKTFDPKVAAHVRADFGVPRDGDEVD